MNVAIGYRWFPTALGYHFERAFVAQGHHIHYVGLPCQSRSGFDSSVSIEQIVAALNPKPDLFLWVDPAGKYFPVGIELLSIPAACYLVDVHLGHWRTEAAKFFDAVFIAQKSFVAHFQDAVGHKQVYWLPLAAATDVHRDWQTERIYDVGFVGNLLREHRQSGRLRRLEMLKQHFQINDFTRQYTPDEVGKLYSQSKIVFNTSIAGDVTMRIFEGTASGALMITDKVENGLDDLFIEGKEIVTYQNDEELLAKIQYYLEHPDKRQQVAQAGQKRTIAQHTYEQRVKTMLEHLTSSSLQLIAPMRQVGIAERSQVRRNIYTHLHMLDALLDDCRDAGENPLKRLWSIAPCLVRRIIL